MVAPAYAGRQYKELQKYYYIFTKPAICHTTKNSAAHAIFWSLLIAISFLGSSFLFGLRVSMQG